MKYKDGDKAVFEPHTSGCTYFGIFTPGKVYTYVTNRFSNMGNFTCFDDTGKENGHDSKHWRLLTNSTQNTTTNQKYQKGDKLRLNSTQVLYEIYGYDASTGYYHIATPGAAFSHLMYDEQHIDKLFTLENNTLKSLWSGWNSSPAWTAIVPGSYIYGGGDPVRIDVPEKHSSAPCECGSDAVYGKNSTPEQHSSYCPKSKG